MKKTLVALAALAATSAFAQSTVQIAGILNTGFKVDQTGTMSQGYLKGDRNNVNFTVKEDLGGGNDLTGFFQMRWNPANGAASYYNGSNSPSFSNGSSLMEQSSVAYNSASFGQVRVGRFTNAWGVADVHAFEDSGYGTNSSLAVHGRYSGQFQYSTPVMGGLQLQAVHAAAAANKFVSAPGGGYVAGVDYSKQQQTGKNIGNSDYYALVANYRNGPLYLFAGSIQGITYDKHTKIGGTYDFGSFKLYANQHNQKDDIAITSNIAATGDASVAAQTAGASGTGMKAHKATEIAVVVPLGLWTARAGILTNDKGLDIGDTTDATKAKKTSIGAEYALSKRTTLMYQRANIKNGVAASSTTALGGFYGTGNVYWFGVNHNF